MLRFHLAFNTGDLALKLGDYVEAEKWFSLAINILEAQKWPHTPLSLRLLRQRTYLFRKRGLLERAEAEYKRVGEICNQIGDMYGLVHIYQMLGGVNRDRGDYEQALVYYQKACTLLEQLGEDAIGIGSSLSGIWNTMAHVYIFQHRWDKALELLSQSLERARRKNNVHEIIASLLKLLYVQVEQDDIQNALKTMSELESFAVEHTYQDALAILNLYKGHLTLQGKVESTFDAALHYYQHALIYALRYNRFLLDEVLNGRPQGTPLRPIIPECLKRGDEGCRMLIALRDWWQTGVNDIGAPRHDTISPIPEGISLLEAERIARGREPGDGTRQRSVVEQIEAALTQEGNP